MKRESLFNTYTLKELRKIVSETRIKNYSHLKKGELVKLMLKNRQKFIRLTAKGVAKASTREPPPKVTLQRRLQRLERLNELYKN